LALLQGGVLVSSDVKRAEFKEAYHKAEAAAFPASVALAAHEAVLAKWTKSRSLMRINHSRLHGLELLAQKDPTFEDYVTKITARLGDAKNAPKTTGLPAGL
jgi:hypothetical protein